jgi:hypothetical protein
MCAIAGTLGRNTSWVQALVGARGQTDDGLLDAWNLQAKVAEAQFLASQEKLWRLIYIELRKTGEPWIGYRSGVGYSELKTPDAAETWMKLFADGTRYVIWGCQGDMNGLGAHWNCAAKVNGDIEFRDYQTNYDNRPIATSHRFIPPQGEDADDYTKLSVFAYSCDKPVSALTRPSSGT